MHTENHHNMSGLSGSALAYALVIMSAVAVLLTSILGFISSQAKYSIQRQSQEQSLRVAEAGVHFYKWYLAHQLNGRTNSQIDAFWSGGTALGQTAPYTADFHDPYGSAIGQYSIEVTPPIAGSTIVYVLVEGWTEKYPAVKRTIRVRLRRPSWSESAVLANNFMRFGEGTEVYGRIHSNGGIRFDGVAHNVISSSLSSFNDPDHGGGDEFGVHTHVTPTDPLPPAAVPARLDVFEAGRSFPLATVDFNGVLGDLNTMKSEAQAGRGRYFDNTGVGRKITLKTNGTYDICKINTANLSSGGTTRTNTITNYVGTVSGATGGHSGTNGNACVAAACCVYASCGWINNGQHSRGKCVSQTNYPIIDNGVIFVEDNIWLNGQISNKKITVVAADISGGPIASVYIPSDLRYTNTDGRDILGIIGQNNIEIPSDSSVVLHIDGALIAQQGRIGAEHYGNYKTSITVNGALATNQRYGFAWTDDTGYATRNLYYDNNLLYYPPPYFPTGTQYLLDLWEEL
jgi:hypothetical protein